MAKPEYIGIEIGGTKLQVVRGRMQVHATCRREIVREKGAAFIQQQMLECLQELMDGKEIAGIGVGFGGPVDHEKGMIRLSHHVAGWNHFPMKEWLEQSTGKPVVIDNDANVAALGEALMGAGREYNHVFYMTIGSGIGGGMVMNGSIYHGRPPGEVEIGHLRLNKMGDTLESKCSGWAVNARLVDFSARHPASALATLAAGYPGQEARCLGTALQQRDADAQRIIGEVADDLAFALSHIVHLFNPGILVIGGGLTLLGEWLLQPVRARLPRHLMQAMLPPPEVRAAALGEAVVPCGALALAQSRIMADDVFSFPKPQP